METFLSSKFDEISIKKKSHPPVRKTRFWGTKKHFPDILVGTDTGGFESFRGELFVFVRNHVHAEGEFVYIGTLSAKIEDADLGVGDTTVETRFGVGLIFFPRTESHQHRPEKTFSRHQRRKVKAGLDMLRNSPCFCSIGNISLDDEPSFRF